MKWEVVTNFSLHLINIFLFTLLLKRLDIPLKLIGANILTTCTVEIYAASLMIKSIDNNFIYHFLTPLQYTLLALAYAIKINNKKIKLIILISIPIAILTSILITLYMQGINEYNSIFCSIKHALITIWILFFFLESFLNKEKIDLLRDPFFWISSGLLMSSLGNFFIEGLMNLLIQKSNTLALNFYLIGVSLTYIFYATIAVSFILIIKKEFSVKS